MNKQTFIVRSEQARANLMATVAKLSTADPAEVTVRPYRRSRSLEQNALLWAWYSVVAQETGHTDEEIHEVCKLKFLPPVFVDVAGEVHEVRRTTTKLKVDEMSRYMDNVHAWAITELGVLLPLPDDRSAA
jgi:hypothetical protein